MLHRIGHIIDEHFQTEITASIYIKLHSDFRIPDVTFELSLNCGYWESGILGFCESGMLEKWGFGILGKWDSGKVGFWESDILGKQDFEKVEF